MTMIQITTTISHQRALPLVKLLHGKTYMDIQVLVCPEGGHFRVYAETNHPDATAEDLSGAVLSILADTFLSA